MSWRPDRLYIANVGGRALLCDSYLIGEWRNDPWKGFDLPEGAWDLVKGREYIEAAHRRGHGSVPITPEATVRLIRSFLRSHPSPSVRVQPSTSLDRDGYREGQRLTGFRTRHGRKVWANAEFLANLTHLIDGEPAQWRNEGYTKPLHALDERGRWIGAVMPVLVPEQRAEVMKRAA